MRINKTTQLKAIDWILRLRKEMRNKTQDRGKNYKYNSYLSEKIDLQLESLRHSLGG